MLLECSPDRRACVEFFVALLVLLAHEVLEHSALNTGVDGAAEHLVLVFTDRVLWRNKLVVNVHVKHTTIVHRNLGHCDIELGALLSEQEACRCEKARHAALLVELALLAVDEFTCVGRGVCVAHEPLLGADFTQVQLFYVLCAKFSQKMMHEVFVAILKLVADDFAVDLVGDTRDPSLVASLKL